MTSFKQFLEEQLLDEEFAAHYDEISAEMDFALAIVSRRKKLGLTQQELADQIGMKQPMLARIEGGQMPSPRTLQRLARGLRVGLLFTGDGVIILPMAGTKAGVQSAIHPVSEREWRFPEFRRVAEQRQKAAECDYTLLARMTGGKTKLQEKETIDDAGIATAA
jgi:transcriptional regulator with XRE-family HTH domain